jgi:hypothetical protein
MNIFGISEQILKQEELNSEEGIISGVIYNSDIRHRIIREDDIEPCLDIFIENHDLSIRLSDEDKSYLWKYLKDLRTVGKKIKIYYHDARLQGNYIYNPSHLIIDNKVIIDFETERKRAIPYLAILLGFDLLVFGYFYFAVKTYNERLYLTDKMLFQNKKYLTLIHNWLTK